MFIDASALTALMMVEHDALDLFARVERAKTRITSPIAVWEAAVAVSRIAGLGIPVARQRVAEYLALAKIELVAVPPEAATLALEAFDRFGKGRHPAKLNMGDCFAYACARHLGQSLLYKGDDFVLTDIAGA